jgi:glycosyltransferase involved in cell wall biosynthesis
VTHDHTARSAPPVTVALDVSPLLGPLTGVGAAVQQMVASLAARDDVDVKQYACSFRGQLVPDMTRLPIPAGVAHRLWAHVSFPRLDRWLRPAQVLHGTNYVVGPSRLPRVVSVYDCWFLRHPERASADVARAGRVLRRAVATGATVHTSSHSTASAIRELLRTDRVEVIPLGPLPMSPPDPDQPPPLKELDGVPFVLAMGTLEQRKNIPTLVAAFGQLDHQHPDLRLVLAGSDGDDRDAVNAAIDALDPKARSKVVLTSRVDDRVKDWLYAHASVLAYPSLDEGFGFPLLEAMQRGVPVVASTAGSIPEVAGPAALLVPADDADELATAIDTVLTDSGEAARLIEAGTSRVEHFSWEATAAGLSRLYHRLAKQGN